MQLRQFIRDLIRVPRVFPGELSVFLRLAGLGSCSPGFSAIAVVAVRTEQLFCLLIYPGFSFERCLIHQVLNRLIKITFTGLPALDSFC